MPRFEIFDTIARLRAERRRFAVATVIRTADVTSAKAGAKAAVTEAGEILGHLGGACVQNAVRKAAAEAMAAGGVRTIRVKPAEKIVALQDPDGVPVYRSGCPSGGTVDILIEGFALPPAVTVIGASVVAGAIARAAGALDVRLSHAESAEGLDLSALGPRDAVIVSTQGRGDLAGLRAALGSGAGFVAMVASSRKAEALKAKLVAEGMPAASVARLKAPAGLDIGAVDPAEIAVSVVAELVAVLRRASVGMGQAGREGVSS